MIEKGIGLELSDRTLSLIVSEPSNKKYDKAVIMLTAGLLHKVGPYRLYTLLARKLASAGILCVRFDLSGVGDSTYIRIQDPLGQSKKDIAAVMDYIEDEYQISKFVAGGLCAGAEDALNTAVIDSRITDLYLIDPFAYSTPKSSRRAFFLRLLRFFMRKWKTDKYVREIYQNTVFQDEETIGYRSRPTREKTSDRKSVV